MINPINKAQVKTLIEHGADVNVKDKDGYTAAMYAKDPEIRTFIKEHETTYSALKRGIANAKQKSEANKNSVAILHHSQTEHE